MNSREPRERFVQGPVDDRQPRLPVDPLRRLAPRGLPETTPSRRCRGCCAGARSPATPAAHSAHAARAAGPPPRASRSALRLLTLPARQHTVLPARRPAPAPGHDVVDVALARPQHPARVLAAPPVALPDGARAQRRPPPGYLGVARRARRPWARAPPRARCARSGRPGARAGLHPLGPRAHGRQRAVGRASMSSPQAVAGHHLRERVGGRARRDGLPVAVEDEHGGFFQDVVHGDGERSENATRPRNGVAAGADKAAFRPNRDFRRGRIPPSEWMGVGSFIPPAARRSGRRQTCGSEERAFFIWKLAGMARKKSPPPRKISGTHDRL